MNKLGKFEDAIECFDEVIKLNPKNKNAWNNKGAILYELGDLKRALECFERTLKIDPILEEAQFNKEKVENELNE